MALSDADKANITQQIADLEDRISAERLASEGLTSKEKDAVANDAVFQKQWQRVHFIIHSYEKEIEKINGEFIKTPFTEQDVIDQSLERGRLYQAPKSQDPKTIPEMVGEGLNPTPKTPHEGTYISLLNRLITTLISGDNGGSPAIGSSLASAYTAGASSIATTSLMTANRWYVMGGVTYVKVGTTTTTTTGTAPNQVTTYSAQIIERYPVSGLDNSCPQNASIVGFDGYSNAERTSLVAVSTPQSMFNIFYNALKAQVSAWKFIIEEQLSIQSNNPDPNMSESAKLANQNKIDTIDDYTTDGSLIKNGLPGIGTIQGIIADRTEYRSTRPGQAKTAKASYYAERVNYTRLRSNIQSGTLTRVKFLGTMKSLVPTGGNPDSAKMLKSLKAMLEQG